MAPRALPCGGGVCQGGQRERIHGESGARGFDHAHPGTSVGFSIMLCGSLSLPSQASLVLVRFWGIVGTALAAVGVRGSGDQQGL